MHRKPVAWGDKASEGLLYGAFEEMIKWKMIVKKTSGYKDASSVYSVLSSGASVKISNRSEEGRFD